MNVKVSQFVSVGVFATAGVFFGRYLQEKYENYLSVRLYLLAGERYKVHELTVGAVL